MIAFTSLRNTAFRRLFAGQLFADLGTWLDYIAVTVIVAYHWQLGPAYIAMIIMAMGLPYLVLGPLVSVKTDFMMPRSVMLICLGCRLPLILP